MTSDAGELCHRCGRRLDRLHIAERRARHPACEPAAAPGGDDGHLAALRVLAAVFPTARIIRDERTP